MEFRELLNVQSHLEVLSGNFTLVFATLTQTQSYDWNVPFSDFFLSLLASQMTEKIMAVKLFTFCRLDLI